jgi:hypothetical protein
VLLRLSPSGGIPCRQQATCGEPLPPFTSGSGALFQTFTKESVFCAFETKVLLSSKRKKHFRWKLELCYVWLFHHVLRPVRNDQKDRRCYCFWNSPRRLNPSLAWKDLFETEGVQSGAITEYVIHSARPRNQMGRSCIIRRYRIVFYR